MRLAREKFVADIADKITSLCEKSDINAAWASKVGERFDVYIGCFFWGTLKR